MLERVAEEARAQPGVASGGFLNLLFMLLGASLVFDRFFSVEIAGQFTPTLVIGLGLGTLGWWVGVVERELRVFLRWSVAFDAVAVISIVAAGGGIGDVVHAPGVLVWFVAGPGVAVLLLDRSRLRSILTGLVIGAGFLLAVVVLRVARGAPALDRGYLQLLGINRNAVDIAVVWLVPVVAASATLNFSRVVRIAFIGSAVVWLTASRGRTGLVCLLMTPAVMFALRPTKGGARLPRILGVGAIGVLVWIGVSNVQVPWLPALERIEQFQSDERTESDEIRSLLNEKALRLAEAHPWLGVGFGRFQLEYHPVAETGKTPHIRRAARDTEAHNTYLDALATTGWPGLVLFVGALATPLYYGVRFARDDDVWALTSGYVLVLFAVTFHTSYGLALTLPIVIVLAAVVRARRRQQTAPLA